MAKRTLPQIDSRYTRLVVTARAPDSASKWHRVRWVVKCDCGESVNVSQNNLLSGAVRSCGCLKRDQTIKRNLTHGYSKQKIYMVWQGMIQRCTNPNSGHYQYYGGRGITVCERWRHSFENFLADMGLPPSARHSIDRYPNNDGNYEPSNCRWATPPQQRRNSRRIHLVTRDGVTLPLLDWNAETGLPIASRINSGWSIEEAFSTPNRYQCRISRHARLEQELCEICGEPCADSRLKRQCEPCADRHNAWRRQHRAKQRMAKATM